MSNAPIVKSTGINFNPKRLDYGGLSWDKDSLAVIANDAGGHGVVLWTVGAHLNYEMSETGCKYLDDLGLDDAPEGISIWEGKYVITGGSYEHPDDCDSMPSSTSHFRQPTDEEWQAIREGRCPWDEKDWRSGTPCKRCDGEGKCECPECDGLGVVFIDQLEQMHEIEEHMNACLRHKAPDYQDPEGDGCPECGWGSK